MSAAKTLILSTLAIAITTAAILTSNIQSHKQGYSEGYIRGTIAGMEQTTNSQREHMAYVAGSLNALQQKIDIEVERVAQ